DRGPELAVRALQVHASDVPEVDAVDQLAVNAKLQLLPAPVRGACLRLRKETHGRRLRRRLLRGRLAIQPEAIPELHACTPCERPNSLRSIWPPLGLPAEVTPPTLPANPATPTAHSLGLPIAA